MKVNVAERIAVVDAVEMLITWIGVNAESIPATHVTGINNATNTIPFIAENPITDIRSFVFTVTKLNAILKAYKDSNKPRIVDMLISNEIVENKFPITGIPEIAGKSHPNITPNNATKNIVVIIVGIAGLVK